MRAGDVDRLIHIGSPPLLPTFRPACLRAEQHVAGTGEGSSPDQVPECPALRPVPETDRRRRPSPLPTGAQPAHVLAPSNSVRTALPCTATFFAVLQKAAGLRARYHCCPLSNG